MTEEIPLSEQHAPQDRAVEAFSILSPQIKEVLLKSRKDWDKHEPRMYESVSSVSDADLAFFDVKKGDLVAVRAGTVSYGTIIFGKIRLPKAGPDAYIHVRIHDPPDDEQSAKDVVFHSLYTEEGGKTPDDDRPKWYRAIMSEKDPIAFFHE